MKTGTEQNETAVAEAAVKETHSEYACGCFVESSSPRYYDHICAACKVWAHATADGEMVDWLNAGYAYSDADEGL